MDIKKRLYSILLAIFLIILGGSLGYYLLYGGKVLFLDCVYMTVISLTSVGFGEVLTVTGNPYAQVFTMILITFGMGVILYGISTLTALMIEGEFLEIIRKKKMDKKISKLRSHIIVCGGGETGRPLVGELVKNRENVVLIEKDQAKIDECKKKVLESLLYVKGDATEDANLIEAGIVNAAGLIVCLPSDKDNLYITMTSRMVNPNLRIITRMIDPKIEAKLIKAGADRVVSPNVIGALRMASEIIRPTVVNFLDSMLRSQQGTLRIHEIMIREDSTIAGKRIMDSGIKDKYSLLILGSKYQTQAIDFNPPPSLELKSGMALIVMGEIDNIERARKEI